jgi:hypothetical protein
MHQDAAHAQGGMNRNHALLQGQPLKSIRRRKS